MRKIFIVISGIIVAFIIIIILFVSPLTKYLIEKYDVKYTGRKIKIDWAYVNPFTGYVHLSNLKVYESGSDSVFLSANSISAHFALLKLISKELEITGLTLNHPKVTISLSRKVLNFADLIERFTPKKSDSTSAPLHFSILNLKINDGEVYYLQKAININYFIKNVNIESSGKRWDEDTVAGNFSFLSGIASGSIKGNFTINLKSLDYRTSVIVQKYDLGIIEQYLKDIMNYGHFTANVDANVRASGNLNDEQDISIRGLMAVNDFHFGKSPTDDYASFDKAVVDVYEMSPKKHLYLIDSSSLIHPFFKYERYDYLDNVETMFGENVSNITTARNNDKRFNLVIEIARYIKSLTQDFFQSYFKVNKVAIYNGDFKFNDYSLNEKFSIGAAPLYFEADSVDKNHERDKVYLKSGIKPYGNVAVSLSINPKDSSDFDLQYHLLKLPAAMFNPYIISYTSFPLDRGTIELNGTWHVSEGDIQSVNHLLVIDPRITKKIKNKDTKHIPLPLVMSFIREQGNVIDYEIPITGNLKNPKFHLHDVIKGIVKNIFVKPPTTPYRMEVKNVEKEIEKSQTLKWGTRQSTLLPNQRKFVEQMADFLVKYPEATITVHPIQFAEKEKEYILFYEAKKKYFLFKNKEKESSFSEDDSEKVDKMSIKDTLFVQYLSKKINDSLLFTTQEKCIKLIGASIVNSRYEQLNRQREAEFILFFKKKGVEKRIKIFSGENKIPYNGFSFYQIDYKNGIPELLSRAYQQMNELNDEAPRKKFEKERKKNQKTL